MRRGSRGILALVTGLSAAGLAACAGPSWYKAGASDDQRASDLAQCEAYARDQTDDFVARIDDTRSGVSTGDDSFQLRDDFRRHDERSRRISLIASCMRQLGYSDDEPPPGEGDATAAPDDES